MNSICSAHISVYLLLPLSFFIHMKTMRKVCFNLSLSMLGHQERHRFSALHRVHQSGLPVRSFRVCKRGEGRSTWAPAPPPMPPKPFTWMWRGEFKRSVQLSRCLFSVFVFFTVNSLPPFYLESNLHWADLLNIMAFFCMLEEMSLC